MVTAEEEKIELNDNEKKIITQIEYYFGDINLRHDKFIKYQLKQNEDWFPLDVLMTFNKLKTLTTDKNEVINAIKKSDSGLIELSECETKIHRIKPLPEFSPEYVKQLNQRTLHLKGFPKDSTFDEIKKFCTEYGEIESIEMRRRDGNFKGCIFVVYKDLGDAEKVLAMENLKYNDLDMLKENKEKYFERKKAFLQSLKDKKKQNVIKTEGAVLKITDVSPETKFIDIKNELSKHSKVAFVSNIDESGQCNVRFEEKDGAKKTLKALKESGVSDDTTEDENKVSVELLGQKVNVSLVTGEDEQKYWQNFSTVMQKYQGNRKNKWQRGKKRRMEDNAGGEGEGEDSSPKKMAKVDGDE